MNKSPAPKLLPLVVVAFLNSSSAQQLSISSVDLKIADGEKISVDARPAGTSPCTIVLSANVRHPVEVKSEGQTDRMFVVSWKNLKRSQLYINIPAWFLNTKPGESGSQGYADLTTGTAEGKDLGATIDKAFTNAKGRPSGTAIDRYNTIRESDARHGLDSAASSTYPRLTRGQMDSLSNVNGGKIVVSALPASVPRTIVEIEIQKIGVVFRVYVLTGRRT